MTQSALDRTDDAASSFDRCIEVRVVAPAPRVRYEKGQPVREAGPDFERVIAAVRPSVEAALQAVYGVGTEIRLVEGKSADVRLTGTFPVKAGEVRQRVSEALADAFDGLELGD
jgi:hypothetical protein